MKSCPGCGTENRDDAKFCKGCGTSIANLPPAAAPRERAARPAIPVSPTRVAPDRKGLYSLIAIVALAIIGGGVYFVIQDREQQRLALEKSKLELENKARTALEEKQRAAAAAEQARRQAEEQAAKIRQEKEQA